MRIISFIGATSFVANNGTASLNDTVPSLNVTSFRPAVPARSVINRTASINDTLPSLNVTNGNGKQLSNTGCSCIGSCGSTTGITSNWCYVSYSCSSASFSYFIYDYYDYCTLCAAGKYLSGSTCYNCGAGTFSSAGDNYCTSCPSGKTSSAGASSCTGCSAGSYLSGSSCYSCSAGYYSSSGATSCTACPSGYTSTAGSTSCAILVDTAVTTTTTSSTASSASTGVVLAGSYLLTGRTCNNLIPGTCDLSCVASYSVTASGNTNVFTPTGTPASGCTCAQLRTTSGSGSIMTTAGSVPFSTLQSSSGVTTSTVGYVGTAWCDLTYSFQAASNSNGNAAKNSAVSDLEGSIGLNLIVAGLMSAVL